MADMQIYFPGGKRVFADYRGFTIATDQPVTGGGDGSAPAPFDLFMASIGTCAGIYVLGFLQQRGIPTDDARLEMTRHVNPQTGLDRPHRDPGPPARRLPGEVPRCRGQRGEPLRREEAPAPAAGVRDHHLGRRRLSPAERFVRRTT